MKALLFAALFAASPAFAQKAPMTDTPPIAAKKAAPNPRHGVTIADDYFWLKDQSYPKVDDKDVLDYLKAENAYFEAAMKPNAALVETLFEEMKARIKEDDASVPQKDGEWLYWVEYEKGAQYKQMVSQACRGR